VRDEVRRRFGAAASRYDAAAPVQRLVADRLAARIVRSGIRPRRILEIGCGTGLLTRRLLAAFPEALLLATDLAPEMVAATRRAVPAEGANLLVLAMDGRLPAAGGSFDLICSSLALQWMDDQPDVFQRLAELLAPGGVLAVSTLLEGTFAEWRDALRAEDLPDGTLRLPPQSAFPLGQWDCETIALSHGNGMGFLRSLRSIGADRPRPGHRPAAPGALRRALTRFDRDAQGLASYRVGYGAWRRPARRGVFVSGTDTGIGKTLVSACLVRAWNADYWKPYQTGLDEDPGDSATVATLAGVTPDRIHPPAAELRAPLSPEDAASLEGCALEPDQLELPAAREGPDAPLVVEGAGGVLVPLSDKVLTTELMERLGLPVVLVARSTLGTINHTLLTLEALRARGIPILGVVLNGPPNAGNRAAIERHGKVRVLAELPPVAPLDAGAVDRLAALFPDPPRT